MNILTNTTNAQFTRAQDVQIPDIFNRRFKTGKEDLDAIFGGEGFIPGFTLTLAAAPGTGKTSFFIQVLELLEKSGKKTAYISGEESVEQLAFSSQRLQVEKVPLANMTCIDTICEEIKKRKFDFVVLDSLPALTTKQPMNAKKREQYIATKLIKLAKEQEVVIGVVLHFTKTGTYKGSTLLPHAVDCNIIMTRNKEDAGLRDVEITKNRFGFSGFVSFAMGHSGFDFNAVETQSSSSSKSASSNNGSSKKQIVGQTISNSPIALTVTDIHTQTQISVGYLTTILRELISENKVRKIGRGPTAVYGRVD